MATVENIFTKVKNENRTILTEYESKQLLETIGIPIPRQKRVLASDGIDNVVEACEEIQYPVVMKLMSDEIYYKSDSGAVKLGIENQTGVQKAYDELMAIECDDANKGISIQELEGKPIAEIIIGAIRDPQFGPTVMLGLGGIMVEVMKDVSFRVAPISDFDSEEMLHELKSYAILDGYRGNDKADLEAIKETLKKIAQLVYDYPEISELDINPLFVYKDRIIAVDARIIIDS